MLQIKIKKHSNTLSILNSFLNAGKVISLQSICQELLLFNKAKSQASSSF